jgi:Flp pilus assembly protein TadG
MNRSYDINGGRKLKPRPCTSRRSERGATVILFSFMVVTVMAPLIGFAVDGSICYWMKTKLSSSVDAAALAAARSLSLAADSNALQTQGASTALQYFNANFQPGTMGTSLPSVSQASPCADNSNPCTTVDKSNAQQLTVTVQATVAVPLYFLRILGHSSTNLSDTGQSVRRSANVMLVLDRSYSMVQAGACNTLVTSAQNFVNYFVDGRDTLGLVTFHVTASYDYTLSTSFKSGSPTLSSTIGQIACTGYTNTDEALNLAYTQLHNLNQPNALNVIVLFTDGQPDSFTAQSFTVKSFADTRYDWTYGNTGNLVSTGISPCTGTIGKGVMLDVDGAPDATGYTAGIFPDTSTAINYSTPNYPPIPTSVISAPGCLFTTSPYTSYSYAVRNDVAYLPPQDAYGNNLTGYKTLAPYPGNSSYNRADTPQNVMYAATNAAWHMGNTIRSNGIYIYTIGLGGTPQQQIDSDFLMRLANDPTLPSSEYNSSQPTGLFIYATAGSLGQAFAQIASEILHLSQ